MFSVIVAIMLRLFEFVMCLVLTFYIGESQLRELQSKVRTEVSSEFWLRMNCADVSSQLFDWGMMRLPRPWYGVGDSFATEADDQFRKKRDAEVIYFLTISN